MKVLSTSQIELDPDTRLILSTRKEPVPAQSPKATKKAIKKINFQLGLMASEGSETFIQVLNDRDYPKNYYLPALLKAQASDKTFAFIFALEKDLCVVAFKDGNLILSEVIAISLVMDVADDITDVLGDDFALYINREAQALLGEHEEWEPVLDSEHKEHVSMAFIEEGLTQNFLFKPKDAFVSAGSESNKKMAFIGGGLGVLLLGLGAAWYFMPSPQSTNTDNVKVVDPYADYKLALDNPVSGALLNEALENYRTLNGLTGWSVDGIKLEGLQLDLALSNRGIRYTSLVEHPALQDFVLNQSQGSMVAQKALAVDDYINFDGIMNASNVALFIKDASLKMDALAVQSQVQEFDRWKQLTLDVKLEKASLESVQTFFEEVSKLPVVLTQVDLKREKLLWDGTIKIDVLGE